MIQQQALFYQTLSPPQLLIKLIKYYFVCKEPNGTPTVPLVTPPNKTYWVADECSKSLTGCRKRWGADTGKVKMGAGYMDWQEGELPYGGFPAAKKMSRLS